MHGSAGWPGSILVAKVITFSSSRTMANENPGCYVIIFFHFTEFILFQLLENSKLIETLSIPLLEPTSTEQCVKFLAVGNNGLPLIGFEPMRLAIQRLLVLMHKPLDHTATLNDAFYISEFVYNDIFLIWETIWAAKYISSANFVLFIALAMVEYYRDIILDNNMDFTDIIKFFNGKNSKFVLVGFYFTPTL